MKNFRFMQRENVTSFYGNNIMELVPKLNDQSEIRTSWIFRTNMDESGLFVRNSSRRFENGRRYDR